VDNLDDGVCLGAELSGEYLGAKQRVSISDRPRITRRHIRDNPCHWSQQSRVVGRHGKNAGNQAALSSFIGWETWTSREDGGNDGDDQIADRQQSRAGYENLFAADAIDKEERQEASNRGNGSIDTTDKKLLLLVELERRVDCRLVILNKGDAWLVGLGIVRKEKGERSGTRGLTRQHGSCPYKRADKQSLPECRCLKQVTPGETTLSLGFLLDVLLNNGKFASAPLVVGSIKMVDAECLLCFFMSAFETEPAWRLANKQNTNAKDQGGNALDSKA